MFNYSTTPIERKSVVRDIFFQGQKVTINEINSVLSTTIDSVFITAWEKLGWGFQSMGLGFNIELLSYVLEHEFRLLVTLTEGNKLYIISANDIRKFMTENETKYHVDKIKLVVLPVKIFRCLRG